MTKMYKAHNIQAHSIRYLLQSNKYLILFNSLDLILTLSSLLY